MPIEEKPVKAGAMSLPLRLHHYGYVVRDQEANRHFMEDVLGLPLVATWAETKFLKEMGRDTSYCHTFYALEDGGALAFFQFADQEMYEKCQSPVGPEVTRFNHISIRVDTARFEDIHRRLAFHNIAIREIDHGYVRSLYARSPDGLELEFTLDPPDAETLATFKRNTAHADLRVWLAGDHRPNNDIRPNQH